MAMSAGKNWRRSAACAGVVALALIVLTLFAVPASACSFKAKFGGPPYGDLTEPRETAIDSAGNVWVLDGGLVKKFGSEGNFLLQFEGSGSGIAIDPEDDVWIASGNTVREYSDEGSLLQSWSVGGLLTSLSGIAIDPEGKVWVVGGYFEESKIFLRVKKFTASGEKLIEFGGEEGSGNGQFKAAEDIAVDSEGNVLVADTKNHRIQEFNGAGEFVRKYGTEGTGNGQLKEPKGLDLDAEGRVWVADTGNNRVQRFSAKGAYQAQFGTKGPNDGQLSEPKGIAVDAGGDIWVADTGNDRVQEFDCP